jgi:hypothetical protein
VNINKLDDLFSPVINLILLIFVNRFFMSVAIEFRVVVLGLGYLAKTIGSHL